ncbi:hypothetical protein BaRGS_00007757, partial [Batillaria attramentaria]
MTYFLFRNIRRIPDLRLNRVSVFTCDPFRRSHQDQLIAHGRSVALTRKDSERRQFNEGARKSEGPTTDGTQTLCFTIRRPGVALSQPCQNPPTARKGDIDTLVSYSALDRSQRWR